MKNRIQVIFSTFIIAALMLTSCQSKKQVVDAKSMTEWEPQEKALLWQIDKGGHKTSYVFGTIHIIDADDYFLPAPTKAAIDKSEEMYFEIDMAEMEDMSNMMSIMMKAFMKDGKKLSDLLNKEDYQLVSDKFSDMGLPMMMLEKIKPMFLSMLAEMDLSGGGMDMLGGGGNMVSYELKFGEMAKQRDMETGGLESIDFQMDLFDQIPYEDQAQMLVESIKNKDESDASDMLAELTKIYVQQDIKGLHDASVSEEGGLDSHTDLLLYNRNRNWIPEISRLSKEKPVFFAVGAGHLGGTQGVLALLKKEGFKLTPMP